MTGTGISWEPYIDRRRTCHVCHQQHVPFGHTHPVDDLAARWDADQPKKAKAKRARRPPSKGALVALAVLATTASFPTPAITARKSRRRNP